MFTGIVPPLVGRAASALEACRHSHSKQTGAAYASSENVMSFRMSCVPHGRTASNFCRSACSCVYLIFCMEGALSGHVRGYSSYCCERVLLEAPTAAFGWLQSKRLGTHDGHGSTGTRVGAGGWLRTWGSI